MCEEKRTNISNICSLFVFKNTGIFLIIIPYIFYTIIIHRSFLFGANLMYAWRRASKTRIVGGFDAKQAAHLGRRASKTRIVGRFDAKPEINKWKRHQKKSRVAVLMLWIQKQVKRHRL